MTRKMTTKAEFFAKWGKQFDADKLETCWATLKSFDWKRKGAAPDSQAGDDTKEIDDSESLPSQAHTELEWPASVEATWPSNVHHTNGIHMHSAWQQPQGTSDKTWAESTSEQHPHMMNWQSAKWYPAYSPTAVWNDLVRTPHTMHSWDWCL